MAEPVKPDIVEQLRARRTQGPLDTTLGFGRTSVPDPLCQTAADEIERLRAELSRLSSPPDVEAVARAIAARRGFTLDISRPYSPKSRTGEAMDDARAAIAAMSGEKDA